MKTNFRRIFALACASLMVVGLSHASGLPSRNVRYSPVTKVVQGNQPLLESYSLLITAPSTLTPGVALSIPLNITVLSKPAGVTDAAALSYISVSPSALSITGPNQGISVTVTVDVPTGGSAGDYAYLIKTSGWSPALTVVDDGATVNVRVNPAGSTDTTPPAVTLQSPGNNSTYTYYPAAGTPLSVPISLVATVGTGGQPISAMRAFLGSAEIPVTAVGLGTLSATASGTLAISAAGSYRIDVQATNNYGTSYASADITVIVSAPPPTIIVASPAANAVFTYPVGGSGVTVPVSFTATSAYGNITSAAATLNGGPVTLSLSGVNSALTATGSASLSISTPGSYTLVFTATNAFGPATPVTVPFSVQAYSPPVTPTVSISAPANGAVITRVAGAPATAVNYAFGATTASGTIQTVSVTLNGVAITPATLSGLNTANVTGGGVLSFSAAGTHVLTVTVTNGSASASATTTFTVNQTLPQVCQNLTWLPPISLNKTIEGGSTMPIKFRLDCGGNFVRDPSTLIAIYEIYANGTMSNPVIYPYGTGSANPPDYAIHGNHYHLNFKTAKGVHRYRIEVYHPFTADGSALQLLGSKELLTKNGQGKDRDDDHDSCDDEDDDHDGHDGHHDDHKDKDKDKGKG
jgi:hypothetical protein